MTASTHFIENIPVPMFSFFPAQMEAKVKKKQKQKIKKTTKKTMVIMQLFKSSKSLEQQFENESLRFLTSSQTIAQN